MRKLLSLTLAFVILCISLLSSAAYAQNADSNTLTLLKELGIMEGDSSGNLNLGNFVTRAEFTKMAVKASKYRNMTATNLKISPYKDVMYKDWYAPYVKTAGDGGLVKGYADGSFRPENTVLYEEAVTVLLRILGYTDDDFGVSWPYGQMGIAQSLGMCDNVECAVGQAMTRNDCAVLLGNFLRTYTKGTQSEYITELDYSIKENIILIATSNEDVSVGSGKIFTSDGTFKINSYFDYSNVGRKGTAVIKNNDELSLFIPDNQAREEYTVYQVLDKSIVVMYGGEYTSIDFDRELTVYNKSEKTSLKNISAELGVGDTLITYSDELGTLDYGFVKTDSLKGPYTVENSNWLSTYGINNPAVNKNGKAVTAAEIKVNDIIYYSEKLNTVWAYEKKATGIYEKAMPNKDNPTSVQVSGETYAIEGVNAFKKLSTGGEYSYGDTVILLFGKNGDIADVKSADSESASVYGFLAETGTKTFTDDTGTYSSYYVKIVKADGSEVYYAVKSDYSDFKNRVVMIELSGRYASLKTTQSVSVSGAVSSKNGTIGNTALDPNVQILEVSTTDISETAEYKTLYTARLDSVNLKNTQVIFAHKNASGAITELFLKNVTGDLNKYGLVTSAPSKNSNGGSYTVNINGEVINVSNSKTFSVSKWQPCKIIYSGGSVDTLTPLSKLKDEISSLSETKLTMGEQDYLVSDTVSAYVRKSDYTYQMISLTELIENQKDYYIYAYYDTLPSSGGRIRVLTAIPK